MEWYVAAPVVSHAKYSCDETQESSLRKAGVGSCGNDISFSGTHRTQVILESGKRHGGCVLGVNPHCTKISGATAREIRLAASQPFICIVCCQKDKP